MNVLGWMQPRHHRAAARSLSTLCAVGAGVSIAAAPLQNAEIRTDGVAVAGVIVVLVILFAVQSRRFDETHRVAWALGPLLAVPAITAIDLLTHDASLAAQIFFLFPALYGASQLPPPGAAVMTGASILGELIVVSTQLPIRAAIVDAGYVTATLVTTSALLTASSERHARLVGRLVQMAAVDPLTGLATRRVLDEAVGSGTSGGAGTALILIDVDHFKSINDRHGHPVGDQVLVQLSKLLLSRSRGSDVVCRLGGDEIAVLLLDCAYPTALARAEDMVATVAAHAFHLPDGATLDISISVGCAHMPTHAAGIRPLYSAADSALYDAKRSGRGRVATMTSVGIQAVSP
ncbi:MULTISPECIES: sensor domain-containing diguanylate cyclase [Nocardioides]|uniref:Diguanylate cyclase n=1 Tax=Nocardioides vastitatis TaxID=2568655 RepID=A0ABW0ZB17_9ACTN|nr:GGDEF domain-containing protein [Nocardioides sp.]THJ01224.1 GGDEF domain-containing protein [Nocardioides sp.]